MTPPPVKKIVLLLSAYLLGGYATPSDESYKTRGEHAEDKNRIHSVLSRVLCPEGEVFLFGSANVTLCLTGGFGFRSCGLVLCASQAVEPSRARSQIFFEANLQSWSTDFIDVIISSLRSAEGFWVAIPTLTTHH